MGKTHTWYLPDAINLDIISNLEGHIVRIDVRPGCLKKIALGLTLLYEGLTGSLHFTDGKLNFDLSQGDATEIRLSPQSLHLYLTRRDLQTWLHFVLRAVRDGYPDVDHFDVETTDTETKASVFIAVHFPLVPNTN